MIVRTEPEAFAVVEDLRREILFYFDERISEQVGGGTLEDAVTVSPRGGEVRVGHGGRTLSVRVEGGLRPDVVYRVTVHPVIRDLFGNQLRDPFELVFSTGAEPTPTALAGEVWDRISGQGLGGALVQAVGPDSLVYLARADGQGVFAFRYLPVGAFSVTAFDDANRDGEPGEREASGSAVAGLALGDTLLVDIPVLLPDTTPAVLGRASALDSVTLVLEFDDYLDPAVDVAGVSVELGRSEGATPAVTRLFHEHQYAAYVSRVRDSLAAVAPPPPAPDSAAADTVAPAPPPPDTAAPGPVAPAAGGRGRAAPRAAAGGPPALPGVRAGRGGAPGPAPAPGRVLPGRRLVGLLDTALEVSEEYQVTVTGVVNLNGLPGGGGEVALVLDAPPEDAQALPADSAGAQTGTPAGDAVAAPPDTLGAGGAS